MVSLLCVAGLGGGHRFCLWLVLGVLTRCVAVLVVVVLGCGLFVALNGVLACSRGGCVVFVLLMFDLLCF